MTPQAEWEKPVLTKLGDIETLTAAGGSLAPDAVMTQTSII